MCGVMPRIFVNRSVGDFVPVHQTTQHYMSENSNDHENLKFHFLLHMKEGILMCYSCFIQLLSSREITLIVRSLPTQID